MLHIKHYRNDTLINNNITEIIIDTLYVPLNNVPNSVRKITVKTSFNVLRRENIIPSNCELIIENTSVVSKECFMNIKEEDYLDITYLSIYHIKFDTFFEIIRNMFNLTHLEFGFNNLTEIPEWVGTLHKLETLKICYNSLTSVPKHIESLTNLKELILYSNQITAVDKCINYLPKLKTLILAYNNIMSMPKHQIKNVNLNYNPYGKYLNKY